MEDFEEGDIAFSEEAMSGLKGLFSSARVDDEATCAQIAQTWAECEYLLDPHSAIGVRAAADANLKPGTPIVSLATAHPAKFPDAIEHAGVGQAPILPLHLDDLFERPERFEVLANDLSEVQGFMSANLRA